MKQLLNKLLIIEDFLLYLYHKTNTNDIYIRQIQTEPQSHQ